MLINDIRAVKQLDRLDAETKLPPGVTGDLLWSAVIGHLLRIQSALTEKKLHFSILHPHILEMDSHCSRIMTQTHIKGSQALKTKDQGVLSSTESF